ncbi:hypothetical protein D3C85_1668810 [compost metagenome]
MMKNTPYTSIVEILVCAKCIKSKVSKNAAISAYSERPNIRFANTYIMGIMPIPNNVPIIRQPKGFRPKT